MYPIIEMRTSERSRRGETNKIDGKNNEMKFTLLCVYVYV